MKTYEQIIQDLTEEEREFVVTAVAEMKDQERKVEGFSRRRQELSAAALKLGVYDKMWDALYSDGENHRVF